MLGRLEHKSPKKFEKTRCFGVRGNLLPMVYILIPLMLCQARSNFVLQFNFKSISWRFLEKNNAKEDKTWLFETVYASAFRVQ